MTKLNFFYVLQSFSIQYFIFKALISAHDQIGKIWLERGSGVDEITIVKEAEKDIAQATDLSPTQNPNMPVETVKVVGLRKVPGQPLGLTVSDIIIMYYY